MIGGQVELVTGAGPAVAELAGPRSAAFLMVLTHGAGGMPGTADVLAAREAGLELGGCVALVTQPYRVRGARAPGSAEKQDAAWAEIVAALRARRRKVPLIQGGRSNGARVACRTAAETGARGVLALAFPLHPPGHPERSRAMELRAAKDAGASVLVVNGDRDPFGIPEEKDAYRVVVLPGQTHALSKDPVAVKPAVASWLREALLAQVRVADGSGSRNVGWAVRCDRVPVRE
jgi:predicted alpha/beta-hydrolase family hydrolase